MKIFSYAIVKSILFSICREIKGFYRFVDHIYFLISKSELRGPVTHNYMSALAIATMDAPNAYATDEGRFNHFRGPVIRQ